MKENKVFRNVKVKEGVEGIDYNKPEKIYKAIWLPEELQNKVKILATKKKMSIIDYIEYLISKDK